MFSTKAGILSLILAPFVINYAHANSNYSSVTFFGDSLTDGGYFLPITQKIPNVTQSGQFTTNPDNTWATSFANQLGLTSVANKFGDNRLGNNYAIGGAKAGETVINRDFGFEIPIASASTQIDTYLANNKVDAKGLYVVWAGANDLLAAFNDPNNANTIGAAVNSQVLNIKKLSEAGANYILVPTIPDIGLTPNVVGTPLQNTVTGVTAQFNQGILSNATRINANVIPLDTFNLLQQITKSPSTYGFTNVTDKACLTPSALLCGSSALIAPDADKTYVFADSVHPTGQVHQLIADYAHAVVTAPSQIGTLPSMIADASNVTNQKLMTHLNQTYHLDKGLTLGSQNDIQPIKPHRNIWLTGSIQGQTLDTTESNGDTQLLVGMDFQHPKSAHAVSGMYANISRKNLTHANTYSGINKTDVAEIGIGIYHSNILDILGGVQVDGAIGYNKLDLDVTRNVSLQNYKTQFKSHTNGEQYYANLQAGYPMKVHNIAITPYLGASINEVRLGKLKEAELSGVAMTFDKQKYHNTNGKIGIKTHQSLQENWAIFGDIYYQATLSDKKDSVTANLNTLPNNKFSTPEAKFDTDKVGITVGLSRQFDEYSANMGVMHENAKASDNTSVFFGLNKAF